MQPCYSSDRSGWGLVCFQTVMVYFSASKSSVNALRNFDNFEKRQRNRYFRVTDLGSHSRLVHECPLRIIFSSLNIQLSKLSRFPVNNRTNPVSLFTLQVVSVFQSRSHSFQICSWPIFLNCRRHGCRNTRLARRVRIAGKLYRVFAAFNDLRFKIQPRGRHKE